jgi:hypothetical protein
MDRHLRVTPYGDIEPSTAPRRWLGNRGIIHDEHGLGKRRWAHKHWITCHTEALGSEDEFLRPGHYTDLFFLDEATAFAAGHRPCWYCRRADAKRFTELWCAANDRASVTAAEMDEVVHGERLDNDHQKRTYASSLLQLPDGTIIDDGGAAKLVLGDRLLPWSLKRYGPPEPRHERTVSVLTPESIVRTFAAGYVPQTGA